MGFVGYVLSIVQQLHENILCSGSFTSRFDISVFIVIQKEKYPSFVISYFRFASVKKESGVVFDTSIVSEWNNI